MEDEDRHHDGFLEEGVIASSNTYGTINPPDLLLDHDLLQHVSSNGPLKSTCPTCHGKGKLTQSQADNLVALIPLGDKRLKPRRTKLYLVIVGALTIICGVLIGFFLWPRSVYAKILKIESVKINIPDNENATVYIDVQVQLQLYNDNYLDVTVKNLNNDVTWNNVYNLKTEIDNFQSIKVNRGDMKNVSFITKQIFNGVAKHKVKKSCLNGWNWSLLEKFDFFLTVSSILRSEDIKESHYGYILCYNSTAISYNPFLKR